MIGKIIGIVRVAECESRDGKLVETGRVIDLAAQRGRPVMVILKNVKGDDYAERDLHTLEERLDAQEPQEISVAESLAILFGGLLGLAILVIVALVVW